MRWSSPSEEAGVDVSVGTLPSLVSVRFAIEQIFGNLLSNAVEVQRCYELGCNNFITKPLDPLTFSKTIQTMGILINIMSYPHCP